jgi:hypothetical protein
MRFRYTQSEYNAVIEAKEDSGLQETVPERAPALFPPASLSLGIAAALGMTLIVITTAVLSALQVEGPAVLTLLGNLWEFAVDLGVLGLALGIASLVAKYPRRRISIIGTSLSTATVLLFTARVVLD